MYMDSVCLGAPNKLKDWDLKFYTYINWLGGYCEWLGEYSSCVPYVRTHVAWVYKAIVTFCSIRMEVLNN